jgi:hypothetical protein
VSVVLFSSSIGSSSGERESACVRNGETTLSSHMIPKLGVNVACSLCSLFLNRGKRNHLDPCSRNPNLRLAEHYKGIHKRQGSLHCLIFHPNHTDIETVKQGNCQ